MATKLTEFDAMKAKGFSRGKAICPRCKQQTFVPYLDERTGEFVDANVFGRCDRQDNCAYHEKVPFGYFKNGNGASKTARIPFVNHKQPPAPNAPARRLPYAYVTKSLARDNSKCNFINYLINIFDKDVANYLINKYKLGVDKHDDVIFWQVDINGEVRSGKTMPYRPDGKRKKKERDKVEFELGWVHKKAKDTSGALLYPNYKPEQCLFGEHLLNENPESPVIIVESEKTAVVASVYAPFYFRNAICLATGGLELLNAAKLEVLRGREITICPDKGKTNEWNKKLKNSGLRYKIKEFGKEEGNDFVDFLESEKAFDENGKALTLTDNLYTWPDGEVFDGFARNPIYINFKYFNHHIKNNEAPNADTVGALYS